MTTEPKRRTFISYSRVNKDFAIKLAQELKSDMIPVWLDQFDIPTGARWDNELENALRDCEIFLVILTPASIASENVKDEIGYAIDHGKSILPVLLETCEIPLRLRRFQYVDFTQKNFSDGVESAKQLLEIFIGETSQTRREEENPTFSQEKDAQAKVERQAQAEAEQLAKQKSEVERKAKETAKVKPAPATINKKISQKGTLIGLAVGVVVCIVLCIAATSLWGGLNSWANSDETSTPDAAISLPSKTATGNDGMILLYVSAGKFMMGNDTGEKDEKPAHAVTLEAFWIDQTEVTNSLFSAFISATGYKTDAEKGGLATIYDGSHWANMKGADWQHPNGPNSNISGKEKHPVVNVSWNDAAAYCKWAGRRLPTEAEWEKAARGTDERTYPWGNKAPNSNLLNFDNNIGDTEKVGTYPSGASSYGALDMAGNVFEWTADWYEMYPGGDPNASTDFGQTHRVLHGGAWSESGDLARSAIRLSLPPGGSGNSFGFRCSRSLP